MAFTLVNNGNEHNRQTSSFFALPVLRVLSMRSFVGVTLCKHRMGSKKVKVAGSDLTELLHQSQQPFASRIRVDGTLTLVAGSA